MSVFASALVPGAAGAQLRTGVGERYDAALWRALPMESRTSVVDFVARNSPGARLTTEGELALRGADVGAPVLVLDGFTMDRQLVPIGMIAAAEVQTAGYAADRADAPAGVVRLRTWSPERTTVDVDSGYQVGEPTPLGVESRELRSAFLAPTVGGTIGRNLGSYLIGVSGDALAADHGRDLFFPDRFTSDRARGQSAARIELRPTARHRFLLMSAADLMRDLDRQPVTHGDEDADPRFTRRGEFAGVGWDVTATDRIDVETRLALRSTVDDETSELCAVDEPRCRATTPVFQNASPQTALANGPRRHARRRVLEAATAARWRSDPRRWWHHQVRLSLRAEHADRTIQREVPTDVLLRLNGAWYDRRTEVFANDPRVESARLGAWETDVDARALVAAVEDQLHLGPSVVLTGGMALVTSSASNRLGLQFADAAFTQHLGAGWDATRDGRTLLTAGIHRRAPPTSETLALFTAGEPTSRVCNWSDTTGDFTSGCVFNGGPSARTAGRPCSPTGVADDGTPCGRTPGVPRVWELSLGAHRHLFRGIGVDGDLVYRRQSGAPIASETNLVWLTSGTALPSSRQFRNGRGAAVFDMSPHPDAFARHLSATIGVRAAGGPFAVRTAYTRTSNRGNVISGAPADFVVSPDLYDSGTEPGKRVRVLAVYQPVWFLSLGFVYRHDQGLPIIVRRYRTSETKAFDDYRDRIGINPGSNINDPADDDRPTRLPSLSMLNLQVALRARPVLGVRAELFTDVLNLLDDESDGPPVREASFVSAPRHLPRSVRLGIRLSH